MPILCGFWSAMALTQPEISASAGDAHTMATMHQLHSSR